MNTSDILSALALLVSGGAFSLEVRRWFESGIKIKLSVMSDAAILGEHPKVDRLAVTVTNQGDAPTMITHMVLLKYDNWWKRWRGKASFTAFVPQPQWPGTEGIPVKLDVNEYWIGMTKYEAKLTEIRETGKLYVGVICTHSNKYILARVPKKQDLPSVSIKQPV